MRDIFDESKIIKKNEIPSVENNEIKSKEVIETNENSVGLSMNIIEKPIDIAIDKDFKDIEIPNIKIDNPLFVFKRNKFTKEITSYSTTKNVTTLKIPKDRLRLMLVNVQNYLYELEFEISILNNLLENTNNEMFEFYKNKLDFFLKECAYVEIKRNTLQKILK